MDKFFVHKISTWQIKEDPLTLNMAAKRRKQYNSFPIGSEVKKGSLIGRVTIIHRGHLNHTHRVVFSNGNYEDLSIAELTQLKELEEELSKKNLVKNPHSILAIQTTNKSDISTSIITSTSTSSTNDDVAGTPKQRSCVGLVNLGNTCYMNSILQILLHLPCLREYFANGAKLEADLNLKNPIGFGGRAAVAVSQLFEKVSERK